jgi:predicted nuclease of restriction endonuclease-like (RecB) superfamily
MKMQKQIDTKNDSTKDSISGYAEVFELLKSDIRESQLKAALSVTKELTLLYWRTGKILSDKTRKEVWGAKILKNLALDIKKEFPGISGFSIRNLNYMRQFAESFPKEDYAAVAAQIP